MWTSAIPVDMTAATLCALSASLAVARARRLRGENPVRLRFTFPTPERANLIVLFDAADHEGPFATRAVLLEGEGVALTRDSVDGLPDGEDGRELIAPMTPAPMSGDSCYRTLGMIGITGAGGPPRGLIQVEIYDRLGRALARQDRAF